MAKSKIKKTFVLDTNVILHDSSCILNFEEHDIVIPLAVIEEIDHFKRGGNVINLNARDFARKLDEITGSNLFNGGVSLGRGKGKIRIAITKQLSSEIRAFFSEDNADHRILDLVYDINRTAKEISPVILVTKDVNMRMKAKALSLHAEDYTTDRVKNAGLLYKGYDILEDFDDSVIANFYSFPGELSSKKAFKKIKPELTPNKYFILKNPGRSVLVNLDGNLEMLRRVEKNPVYGITPRNAEQTFAVDALTNNKIPLVTLTGKAGTGKTLLALASALEIRKYYRQIYISRPIVPLSNKDIGYLPGDIESKIGPYMQPLHDNLRVIQDQFPETDKNHQAIANMLKEQKLVIEPLTYIRGRSFQRIFFIIDEAQNLTPHEVKTIITRAGEGVKIVFTGDIYQIDHPYLDAESNGLSYLIDHFKGQKLYAHINLEKGERSELAELASNLL